MSLDQEQTDEDLRAVFAMVDEDNSGFLDMEEVALVIEYFAGMSKHLHASGKCLHSMKPLHTRCLHGDPLRCSSR